MAFNGKWQLVSSENVGAFSKSIGVTDEKLAEHKELGNPDANVVEDVSVDAASVNINITIGGNAFRTSKLPVGAEADEPALDGRPAKHFITVTGSTMTRKQSGEGYEATYTRTVEGDAMTVTMTGPGGVVGTRKYKKI